MRKSGFTVAEFVISITVMVILMTATFPIVFKKTTGEERIIRNDGEKTCTCNGFKAFLYKTTQTLLDLSLIQEEEMNLSLFN